MKTASFSTYKGEGRICIARYAPRSTPAGYRMYPKLAPGNWFNSASKEKYTQLYHEEVLGKLNAASVWSELHLLAGGNEPYLLCYEKLINPSEWCHRQMVAEWFRRELGVIVEEYNPRATPQTQFMF